MSVLETAQTVPVEGYKEGHRTSQIVWKTIVSKGLPLVDVNYWFSSGSEAVDIH